MEETESSFDKEKLAERLAKSSGGVAVIKVGAASETEMKEKKLRMEDALAMMFLLKSMWTFSISWMTFLMTVYQLQEP